MQEFLFIAYIWADYEKQMEKYLSNSVDRISVEREQGMSGIQKESRIRRICGLVLMLILCLTFFTACSSARVIFTTGYGEDEVFRIDSVICTLPEFMVYLTNTQNQYEDVYGPEIWNISLDGVTLEENVKDMVLAKIAQIKTMYLLAQSKDVELTETEQGQVEQAAQEYFRMLNDTEVELLGVNLDTIVQLYKEYAMADKVYQYIIQDINPEISDDEARTITVQHILLRTYVNDGTGTRVTYTDDLKESVYERACAIREQAVSGEYNFFDLASRYSEDTTVTYSFGKGEMDEAFEAAAFALETDEISQVVESESGYHIIKCINTFDREQTDANKLEIVEERRREVFGQEYDAFVEKLNRGLNEKLWQQVGFLHDENVTTLNFFEVYEKYFS